MNINLQFNCDKTKVLECLGCIEGTPTFNTYSTIYDEIIIENIDFLKPKGFYVFTSQFKNTFTQNFDKIVCCAVTMGIQGEAKINSYFEQDDPFKGMLLGSIIDMALFNASEQLYVQILGDAVSEGMMLSGRFEPGTSSGLDAGYLDLIVDAINSTESSGITINQYHMLYPAKSMGYFYGMGKNLEASHYDHDCRTCGSLNCPYRMVCLKIRSEQLETILKVRKSTNLLKVLQSNRIPVDADCSGNRICGKCKVRIISGDKSPSEKELSYLTKHEIDVGVRLACFINIEEDTVIEIEKKEYEILSDFEFPQIHNRRYNTVKIENFKIIIQSNFSAVDSINKFTGMNLSYSLIALRQLSYLLEKENLCLLTRDINTVERVFCNLDSPEFYVLGIDIGTTTVALALANCNQNKVKGIHKFANPQKLYGADVISRIQYAISDKEKLLTKTIKKSILDGIEKLISSTKIDKNQIVEIAISGNTSMLYLLMDICTKTLSVSPFLTTCTSKITLPFESLMSSHLLSCDVVLLPGISAYVGSDILAGLYYCNLLDVEESFLFIDIGTNGELVINVNGHFLCAATAAGPAFEGSNISCGMGSLQGAICKVNGNESGFILETIGNKTPAGICGSGLIDLIAVCLKSGKIDSSGKIVNGDTISVYNDKISISLNQKDIREFQLAKGAISAGVKYLVSLCGCLLEDLDHLIIAGGFGCHINIDNAIEVGLIPPVLKNKTKFVGNSSLGGCMRYLMESNSKAKIAQLKSQCRYIELSCSQEFYDLYIEEMNFTSN